MDPTYNKLPYEVLALKPDVSLHELWESRPQANMDTPGQFEDFKTVQPRVCDIINQTILKFRFQYRVHVFDYIMLKSGNENLLACCTCQGERCNSQHIRSSNSCMPLNMFLL